jgi:hypothetical protein
VASQAHFKACSIGDNGGTCEMIGTHLSICQPKEAPAGISPVAMDPSRNLSDICASPNPPLLVACASPTMQLRAPRPLRHFAVSNSPRYGLNSLCLSKLRSLQQSLTIAFLSLSNIEANGGGIEETRHQGREKTGISDLTILQPGIAGVPGLSAEK